MIVNTHNMEQNSFNGTPPLPKVRLTGMPSLSKDVRFEALNSGLNVIKSYGEFKTVHCSGR